MPYYPLSHPPSLSPALSLQVLKITHKTKAMAYNSTKSALSEAAILASSVVQQSPFIVKLLGSAPCQHDLSRTLEHSLTHAL